MDEKNTLLEDKPSEAALLSVGKPSDAALLKELELQWKDHQDMRDQSWKTLTNTTLFFLGTVGLEIKGVGEFVMVTAYVALILVAIFGWAVAKHHGVRQKQKFDIIDRCEELLGLDEEMNPFLKVKDNYRFLKGGRYYSVLPKWFSVALFTQVMEFCIALVAAVLLVRTFFRH